MKFKRHYNLTKGEINLTPLVDVVFQLIIFFMLSSSFIMQPGIKVKLPKAETTEIMRQKEIFIDITENGIIFFEGKQVPLERIEDLFKEVIRNKKDEEIIVVIRGDKETKHGIVVSVMDKARKCGIDKIAIATTPEFEK